MKSKIEPLGSPHLMMCISSHRVPGVYQQFLLGLALL